MTTLVDIKNALFSHFLISSTFNLDEDLKSVRVDPKGGSPDFVEHKAAIVRFALDDFVKLGVLACITPALYVLIQPISQVNQSVVITPLTAMMIADIVNDFVTQTGEKKATGYVVNQLAITDRDIGALCHVCHGLLSNLSDGDESGPAAESDPARN